MRQLTEEEGGRTRVPLALQEAAAACVCLGRLQHVSAHMK